MTWKEAADKWNAGEVVWSGELGGLGPAYEQCIQLLLFEILSSWDDSKELECGEEYSEVYNATVNEAVARLKHLGFSGAQVGAAKGTAFQFIKHGYEAMMAKLPDDRKIQVTKNFPNP